MATSTRDYTPVAKGGFWNSTKPPLSKETQDLLKAGQGLPVKAHSTSSRKHHNGEATADRKKVLNPKNYLGGIRSKDKIQNIVKKQNEDTPTYTPPFNTKKITDNDKRRLQNLMAYGQDVTNADEVARNTNTLPQRDEPIEIDRFEEVLAEIEDRKEFLETMESLGKGKELKSRILAEISMKIRELEKIDRKRSQEVKDSFPADQLSSRFTSPIQPWEE
ncbi:uncharacterized protein TRIADDRAFT_53654 [Trichoplax adhaerens]|uniref:Uncharacterized protein n=1 Tax=Trichoplax adhaerens TaxID=10228 RepID=B3RPT4_TRIAD|nr:hypothetical protein TRIADDRAFT_53654 [Trichoplax adhaerens]EDV27695.1 hypothetical protein TRIADDRAFT_53654 [Trichoplax adhaerens]|eukprot:XP_002109529.1 hypothetical protein TRIADDRAFT_53654 [Trichoplax adhaerens]